MNPEKRSSASQFYIVQGKVYDEPVLEAAERTLLRQLNAAENDFYPRETRSKPLRRGDRLPGLIPDFKLDPALIKIPCRGSALQQSNERSERGVSFPAKPFAVSFQVRSSPDTAAEIKKKRKNRRRTPRTDIEANRRRVQLTQRPDQPVRQPHSRRIVPEGPVRRGVKRFKIDAERKRASPAKNLVPVEEQVDFIFLAEDVEKRSRPFQRG